jgi:hypothetical protein
MAKKPIKRSSARPKAKKPAASSPPLLGTLFRGLIGLFKEDLPESEYRGSGRCDTDVAGVATYQDNLETICGGRTTQAAKFAVNARVIPDAEAGLTHVEIRGRRVGHLKPSDAKFLAKQLEKAGVGPCVLKVTAVVLGGRRKKNGENEEFTVKLCLPPRPEKKPPTVTTPPGDD